MRNEQQDVEFESLIGEHVLTGVDHGELPPDPKNYRYESASTLRFPASDAPKGNE